MFRLMFWCTVLCASMVHSQPTACTNDAHCSKGLFCEAHSCRQCLSCAAMNREPPRYHTDCIKSLIECGPCVEGYSQDRSGVSSDCAAAADGGVSPYVWLGLAIALAFTVIVLTILVFLYLHRNTESLKIFTSTRASVHGQFAPATAPQPPPPYNVAGYDYAPQHPFVEEASPLVKQSELVRPNARESAGSQAARVYNNPAYVRGAPIPGSPELSFEDESSRDVPFIPHDEDTMESPWTPVSPTTNAALDANGNDTNAATSDVSGDGGAVVPAVRRAPASDLAPPTKMLCLPQDTNNNKNSDQDSSEDSNPASASGGTSVTLNFNLNVNTNAVHQLNNVTL